jgi:hypothetical protein
VRCAAAAGVVLLWLSGCGRPPPNREQLAREILNTDPDFSWVLDKHRALSNRVHTYEQELALKRTTIEQNIAKMRKELMAAAADVTHKIAELKKQIEPDRQRFELALSMAGEELHTKRFQRASLGRKITQLRKAGKAQQHVWTDEERAKQEAQLNEAARDTKRLDREIEGIKAHMRLLKVKILLIRF